VDAGWRALSLGQPFSRHITVHWSRAAIKDGDAAHSTGRLVKLASDWVRSQGSSLLWCWVRENDEGDNSKGSHVHILIACPASIPLGRMWRRWLRKITGQPYRRGRSGRGQSARRSPARSATAPCIEPNLVAVLNYVCKGVHPSYAERLGIPYTEPGGQIIGKRAAICQALSARQSSS
jgi:hypothetical protein